MGGHYTRHRFVSQFVGRPWWITAVGTASVVAYVLVVYFFGPALAWGNNIVLLGGFVGGLVAGFGLGTNSYDGMVAGLRAGAYGVVVLALLAVVALFVLWYSASRQLFLYWAPFYGAVSVVALVPVYGFSGVVGGALGVVVRRWVVPDHLNPDAY
ncbi:DUF5518 domain-containing protein [Salinirubrum litoreum]|uniref:DUF5518 domain-containing protein n=1 Tax=Salinirubrum litoreum TaxID=1126234 RepID=A0ABD5RGL4_9EURY|nr:DUF5518 domain-containing protein [Salinirubrum litoreum]